MRTLLWFRMLRETCVLHFGNSLGCFAVRKQFVRGRRETCRLTRTAPIAFGDTSIYANRCRSRSARLRGVTEDLRSKGFKPGRRSCVEDSTMSGTQLPVLPLL